uniref:G-protein coupled receptors family 1 profile domain-containing protein n=1 Tax=Amphimedon queenslandica TaxID=400682 RepID=A0A1X7TTZ6_AMPQE
MITVDCSNFSCSSSTFGELSLANEAEFSLVIERMERNYTFTGDFSPEAVAGVLSIEMILALIANGVVLVITIYQRKSWKQSSTIFFTSLILAHLVLTLYLPFSIAALAAGEWIIGETDEDKEGTCHFNGFIILFSAYIVFMTLCLISIDRFLFIVKPHLHKRFMSPRVALVLVIIVWIVNAAFYSAGFIDGSGIVYQYVVWTFCFTRKFINNQSMIVGESVYASKKKRLFGIFGSMLLVYGICFIPAIFFGTLLAIIDFPVVLGITALIFFFLAVVLSPVVQAYFRPEINSVIVNIVCRKILKKKPNTLATSSTCNSSSAAVELRVSSLDV